MTHVIRTGRPPLAADLGSRTRARRRAHIRAAVRVRNPVGSSRSVHDASDALYRPSQPGGGRLPFITRMGANIRWCLHCEAARER